MVLISHVYFQLECSLRAQRIQLAEMEENLTSLRSMSNAGDSVALDATQELEDLVSRESGRLSVQSWAQIPNLFENRTMASLGRFF